MIGLPSFERGTPLTEVLAALDETGGVILRDLIDPTAVARISEEVRPHLAATDPDVPHVNDILQEFYAGVRSITGLAGKSAGFVDKVLLHAQLLEVADAIIGPNSASIALNVAQLAAREPGAQRQWIHRDQEVWSFLPQPHPEVEVSVVVALDAFTHANGATAVIPGSHRWDKDRRPEENEVTYAEMSAGSALLYLGSTLHAGGTNSSDQTRPGIHMSYVAGWLRTEENCCLAIPPSVAATLPRRAQELLGYAMHDAAAVGGGYLGCVDLQDPVDLLAAGALSV